MTLHFSKDIKLYGWIDSHPVGQSRRIYETLNKEYKIGVWIRPYNFECTKYVVRFHHQLSFLQNYVYLLIGDLDSCKVYVDKFLVKMSNLKAFY